MGLIVPWPVLAADVILFIAIGYAILFLLKRVNKYSDPDLNNLIIYTSIFLIIGELGRATDLVDDFCCPGAFENFQYLTYFISIVGVIYTVLHYVKFVESRYVPTIRPRVELKSKAQIVFSKSRFLEVLNTLKDKDAKILAITRFPELYEGFDEGRVSLVWMTQTGEGIPPTSLHVLQGVVADFLRKNPNSVVIIDCLEYLLLYNDFRSVFKFLTGLKDYVVFQKRSRLILLVDEGTISQREKNLLLREFEPL
jgi:hypothetical protein